MKTLKIISSILNEDFDKDLLVQLLPSINYEELVKTGSAHLMIPAIYCKLKSRNLLELLPNDLVSYLQEIADLNYHRNKTILDEIYFISNLLKKENIHHVFLKGAALLVSNCFDKINERMIGDIDILVAEHQLLEAQIILKRNNYCTTHSNIEYKHYNHRHLPRLVAKDKIAALEIHKKLLRKGEDKNFNSKDLLKNKVLVNGVYIGSLKDLLHHNIYSQQINNRSYYFNSFSLRSAYDHKNLSLVNKTPVDCNKYTKDYLNKFNLFFNELQDKKNNFRTYRYLLKQQNNYLSYLSYQLLNFFRLFIKLIQIMQLFVVNPSYRNDLLKKYNRSI
jgi:hypothetical protein